MAQESNLPVFPFFPFFSKEILSWGGLRNDLALTPSDSFLIS